MKKSIIKIMICLLLIFSMCSAFFIFPGSALSKTYKDEYEHKLDDSLKQIIDASDEDDIINVAMWLDEPDERKREIESEKANRIVDFEKLVQKEKREISYGKSKDADEEKITQIATEQAKLVVNNYVERKLITENNGRILSKLSADYGIDNEVTFVSRFTPLVFVQLKKSNIISAAMDDEVKKLYYIDETNCEAIEEYYNNTQLEEEPLPNRDVIPTYGYWQTITGIESMRNAHSLSGLGVKIGHIERNGVPDKTLPVFDYANTEYTNNELGIIKPKNLIIIDDTPDNGIDDNPVNSHASYTAKLIIGKSSDYTGAAINARLFCNSFNNCNPLYSNYDNYTKQFLAIERLLEENINILNASIMMGSYETYDSCSMFFDYIVNNYHVTVCYSAGNGGPEKIMWSGATAYNIITVGNINDHNTLSTDDDTFYSTRFLNSNTLQFKPDLCAPGHHASAPGSNMVNGEHSGGTSAAAPIVSGICAMLMEDFPILKNKPMLMKSVLLSSAKRIYNMDNQTTGANSSLPALSHHYGAGMVNEEYAYQLLINYRYANYSAVDWTNNSTITISIPYSSSDLLHERRIYASVCWLYDVSINNNLHIFDNEELYVVNMPKQYYIELKDPNNTTVSSSIYLYDKKQVLGYQPTVAGTYTLKITKFGTGTVYTDLSVSYSKPVDV